MTIINDTDRVITVYNDSLEESIGIGKSILLDDACLGQESALCVRYMTLQELKQSIETGWDQSTFGKRWFYKWYIHWEFPVQCKLRIQDADEIHIMHRVHEIPTLLFPHMTVRKLCCTAGKGVEVEHFFASAKERRRFLILQWAKSLLWIAVCIPWILAVWNAVPAMNTTVEWLFNGVWYLLFAMIPLCFLVPNVKFLFFGMKWKSNTPAFPHL